MKITRQRLKQIIMEEMDSLNIDDTGRGDGENAPANSKESSEETGEISESETIGISQQIAQTLIDAGLVGANSPQELAQALMGLGKMGIALAGGGAMATAAIAGRDAISTLFGTEEEAQVEDTLEEESDGSGEEEGDTLELMITNAIKKQIKEMTSKKA